ncbi:MAG TPA: LacI family DNA-binding transcriptional regulator [Chthoniobacteraceae bacterium]|jgi:DNA-binding LacI/PurR family transcriptional regulator|nr:LacI family DNA-binding transcriptional regulator [Chthoniobacteraceae bacterium]
MSEDPDAAPASAPTMHEIAERAGVGKATVSLALRDDPRLRPETRRRIQKLAAKMGYRTNATVANLMAQLRASRTPKYQATLGLLNVSSDPKTLSGLCTFREWVKGCHERAIQLGYGLDPFWVHEPGISPGRLSKILDSRNIRGIIVAALLDRSGLPEEFDPVWKRFACVVVGVQPSWPLLNFSTNDQFSTALQATQRLWSYGYRRIALVLSPEVDAMVERRFSAGFWAAQEGFEGCERIPAFPFHPSREVSFRAWYAQHHPDAVVCVHDEVKKWVTGMNLNIPDDIALAHLDRHEELPDWSGMYQNNTLVGAAAVDMLVGQLHRNEVGLPEFAKASFIQSSWVDGPTAIRHPVRKTARAGKTTGEPVINPA